MVGRARFQATLDESDMLENGKNGKNGQNGQNVIWRSYRAQQLTTYQNHNPE